MIWDEDDDCVYWNDLDVLAAMSVVPIAWLTAEMIIGEMNIVGDGRKIIPALKRLLAKGLIVRAGSNPTEWRLSDEEADRVVKERERIRIDNISPPFPS